MAAPTRAYAKTFAVDRGRIFVGSFSLDPRSATQHRNEHRHGQSAAYDASVRALRYAIPRVACEVRQTSDGRSIELMEETEPGTGALLQLWIGLLSILPIDWLL